MANEFPKSHFTGIDITPVFPRESKPDNADFMEANILDGLPFEDNVFDYVHMRFLITSFSANDWKVAINEIVRVTKSGGIIEIVEEELEPRKDGPISRLLFSARKCFFFCADLPIKGFSRFFFFFLTNFFFLVFMDLTSRNVDFTIYSRMFDLLNDVESLTNVKKEEITASYGKWAGRVGSLLSDNTGN